MKTKISVTFKKQPKATGLSSISEPYGPQIDIKLNKKKVGLICPPTAHTKDDLWRIQFSVPRTPTPDCSCDSKWIVLKNKGNNEVEARNIAKDFVVLHHDKLYAFEE